MRKRRISAVEYHSLGRTLREAAEEDKYEMTIIITRQIAPTGCRRSEIISQKWTEADIEASCLRG